MRNFHKRYAIIESPSPFVVFVTCYYYSTLSSFCVYLIVIEKVFIWQESAVRGDFHSFIEVNISKHSSNKQVSACLKC